MSKTCLQSGDNSKSGCPSNQVNGTIITGTTLSSGERTATSDSTSLCNQVFDYGTYQTVDAYSFDSDYVSCAPDYTGFFYIQNNCPANTTTSTITIQIDYTGSTCSKSYTNSWQNNWKIAVGIVGGVFALIFICVIWSSCRKRRRMNQMANTAPMIPPPPPMGAMHSTTYSATPATFTATPTTNTYIPSGPTGPPNNFPPPPPGYPQPSYPAEGGANQPAIWYKGAPENKV